ncbi:glycoside hydrolase family 18 protein [Photobacterium lutimaris]|uniref:chitinase n=1 Tax=Photobacterium lutimaris TaxID=388278 RepID=A0A2T3J165_9GAMM|nr:glycoside hydrolase family 18 protein [Photobacterium lutimaris]PSU34821.1 chitinase [Photobacterium lutimaris]TDR77155.1 GH18 family chitinase [Photobacterium lutimaris]
MAKSGFRCILKRSLIAFCVLAQSSFSLAHVPQLVLYYPDWQIYQKASPVLSELAIDNATHLVYAFLAVCGPVTHSSENIQQLMEKRCAGKPIGHVVVLDEHAALKANLRGNTSHQTYYRGNFGQLKYLKEQNPDLTIIASIGGWTLSEPFHTVTANQQYQANMIRSIRALLKKYPFFGGVQINWEYPGGYGLSGLGLNERESEKQGYTQLLHGVRAELDKLGNEMLSSYELSITYNASQKHRGSIDWPKVSPLLSTVYLMSYDYHGPWRNIVGHHTNLHETPLTPEGLSVSSQVQHLLEQSIPATKILIGSPFYGRGWKGVDNVSENNLEALTAKEIDGLSSSLTESGFIRYNDLSQHFLGNEENGFVYFYDQQAEAAVLYNPASKDYITFESPRSAKAKATYVNQQQLGGMFIWEVTADHQNQLLDAISSGLESSPQ